MSIKRTCPSKRRFRELGWGFVFLGKQICHLLPHGWVGHEYYLGLDAFLAVKTIAFVALVPGLIGGVMFLFGAAYWAAPYGSGITVGQEDWSLLFTVTGIVFSGVSASLLIRGQTRKTLLATSRLVVPLLPAGILLALATGWVATGSGFNPGGITSDNYGSPFTWKVEQYSCPPPCVQANGSIYNPLFFALDSLFFTLVCYVVLREYRSRTKNDIAESFAGTRVKQLASHEAFVN